MTSRMRRYVCARCQEVRWIHNYHAGMTTCKWCGGSDFVAQQSGGLARVATPLANVALLARPRRMTLYRCPHCDWSVIVETGGSQPGLQVVGRPGANYCPACFERSVPKVEAREI